MTNQCIGVGNSLIIDQLLKGSTVEDISDRVIPLSGGSFGSLTAKRMGNLIHIACNINFPDPITDCTNILQLENLPAPNVQYMPVQISDRNDSSYLFGKAFLVTDANGYTYLNYVTNGAGMKYAYIAIDYIVL